MSATRIPALLLIPGALLFSQCKVSKNQTQPNDEKKITLHEVVIKPDHSKNAPYRASRTRKFDLIHTSLAISLDYTKQHVLGKALLTLKPYFYAQQELQLDARGFDIHRVALLRNNDTINPVYTYADNKLNITLDRSYTRDEEVRIYIDYTAKPNELKTKSGKAISENKGLYFINPLGTDPTKPRQVWTQGETQSSSAWFPTIDAPNEKHTQDIAITVEKKDETLSNGELMYSIDYENGLRTDYWKQTLPHAPYLTMLAVGEFVKTKDYWRDSVEVNYYLEKDFAPYAKLIFGNTPEMIECFSKRLGYDYAWDKYAQIVVRDFVSGAMENTGAVVHYDAVQHDSRAHLDNTHEDIISHELFHHWFGDLVTCESWSNLPLNESFATYGTYLWDEYKYGRMDADKEFDQNLKAYLGQKIKHKTIPIRYHYDEADDMFDVVSYQKGSRILHMLRYTVGDEAFFEALKRYLHQYAFKTAEIHDLRMVFEDVTGEDLNWFFNQWFMKAGHPKLQINYTYSSDLKNVTVKVQQKQDSSVGLYRLPVNIDLYTAGKVIRKQVVIKNQSDSFTLAADDRIRFTNFDADKVLLAEISDMKPAGEYGLMLQQAPLFMDKQQASLGLSAEHDSLDVELKQHIAYCINHENWAVRDLGITMITKLDDEDRRVFANDLERMANNDPKSFNRADAIELLSEIDKNKYTDLFIAKTNDSSYMVVGSAISALAAAQPDKAMEIATPMMKLKSGAVQTEIAKIIADIGKGDYNAYFQEQSTGAGFYKYGILQAYGDYLMRQDTNAVNTAIPFLKEKVTGSDIYLKYISINVLSQLADHYRKQKEEVAPQTNGKKQPALTDQQKKQIEGYEAMVTKLQNAAAGSLE